MNVPIGDVNMKSCEQDQTRLKCVIEFLDNVLEDGRDCYRKPPTPLFADGININTGEHLYWEDEDNRKFVMSNLGSQQNLFRALKAASILTGDKKYENAAKESIEYHFDYLMDSSGLMQWGGHRFIDLKTLNIVSTKGMFHELKNHFPYYELMFLVNPEKTEKFISAFWNAHVYDWGNLEINRHGEYGLQMGRLWDNEFHNPRPFRETKGLSFLNVGNDLMYSAGILYKITNKKGAIIWCKRLAQMYVNARHPETRLGSYKFTQPIKREEGPHDSNDPRFTLSIYGDRAKRQLGPEFGEIALEGNMLLRYQAETIYVVNAIMLMMLAEEIGKEGDVFVDWATEGLKAFYKYGYVVEKNCFRPMLADGTDLTGFELKRSGYYGKKGTVFNQYPADCRYLRAYMMAFRLTGDEELWEMARNIARGNKLGDIGEYLGDAARLNMDIDIADANALFAVLEIYKTVKDPAYLELARRIGNNIINYKFSRGFFVSDPDCEQVNFDTIEPLALLSLQAAIEGKSELVPKFINGMGRLRQ